MGRYRVPFIVYFYWNFQFGSLFLHFFFLGEYSVGIFGIAVDGIIIFHVFANGSNPSN